MVRETLTTLSLDDPALALVTASAAVRFATSRDPSDLGELGGAAPVVYTYRRLTRGQRLFAEGAGTEAERYERSFLAGITRLSGGFFAEDTGLSAWAPEGVGGREYVAMTGDERDYLEAVIGPAAIVDVGAVIYVRSWLRPKAVPLFPRPPTSLLAWDALPRPSAVPSPAGAAPSSEALSAE